MEFDDFVFKMHVVHGGGNEPNFAADGNVRLVGVSHPKGPPPPGVRRIATANLGSVALLARIPSPNMTHSSANDMQDCHALLRY